MAKYAVISQETNKVVNCIEWDGVSKWMPKKGQFVVKSDVADRDDDYLPAQDCFKKTMNGKIYHKDFDCNDMKTGKKCPIGSKLS